MQYNAILKLYTVSDRGNTCMYHFEFHGFIRDLKLGGGGGGQSPGSLEEK